MRPLIAFVVTIIGAPICALIGYEIAGTTGPSSVAFLGFVTPALAVACNVCQLSRDRVTA